MMGEVFEILPVTKSLAMSVMGLPIDFVENRWNWEAMANKVNGLEVLKLTAYPCGNEAEYEMKEGCEEYVGKLVTKAKRSELIDIAWENFDLFISEVARQRKTCEEIGFEWTIPMNDDEAIAKRDETLRLAESIGYELKEDPNNHLKMKVIKSLTPIEFTDREVSGMLTRKHEWESHSKKASNRSWDKIYVVLMGTQIIFYVDNENYRTDPGVTFRWEPWLDLVGGFAEVAADYTRKKHVFRLRLANGGIYLFEAADDEQMNVWVNTINQAAQAHEEGPGKSQTLPPGSERKEEPKRRSFFTLKKK